MIEIRFVTDKADRIVSYTVDGHAEYADPGEDIVCAGVSATTIGTLNALEELLGIQPGVESKENGYLSVTIPEIDDERKSEDIQLLLHAMRVTLQSIEQSYGEYVSIKHLNSKGGKTP
ncbi:ribosomal-processing cysteine protease Prp [Marinicrinis lubricantis]|uniref:Ribosomal processing cysteine protease Prp n=1 Tax=Marinicrinis lubricantis TaxID=2086470 RepID=A0ABW1ITK6_9BACL